MILVSALLAAGGCASPGHGITTINVIGNDGSRITGYYVEKGTRVPISGQLPFVMAHDDLSELEIWKEHPAQVLTLAAQNDDQGWHSEVMSQAGDGVAGLRVRVRDGLIVDEIK